MSDNMSLLIEVGGWCGDAGVVESVCVYLAPEHHKVHLWPKVFGQ